MRKACWALGERQFETIQLTLAPSTAIKTAGRWRDKGERIADRLFSPSRFPSLLLFFFFICPFIYLLSHIVISCPFTLHLAANGAFTSNRQTAPTASPQITIPALALGIPLCHAPPTPPSIPDPLSPSTLYNHQDCAKAKELKEYLLGGMTNT